MRKIINLILIVILSLVLTGCVIGGETLPKVDTPVIKTVQDNIVYWGSVDGAESYVVNIDDVFEKKTSELSFDLNEVLKESKNGYVKVKANGNNVTNKDSEWSELFNYEFVKDSGGNNQETQKQKLQTPTITGYSNNTVSWGAVDNANGYVVRINGNEERVYNTSYTVSFNESCNFTVQIKAVVNTADENYTDSDWSNMNNYQYVKQETGNDYYDDYLKYQLGFGINIITAEYLNSKDIKSSSFLDIEKLSNMYKLLSSNVSYTTFETIEETSYESFSMDVANKYTFGSSASFGVDAGSFGFSATLTQKIDIDSSFKMTSKTKQYYNLGYQNIIDKEWAIMNFDSKEVSEENILTKFALNQLAEINNTEDTVKQEELIIKFFDIFGTHIITDALYGGKVEVLFYMLTNDESFDFSLTSAYNSSLKGEGNYGPYEGSAETSVNISNAISSSIATGKTVSQFKARFIGGGAIGMSGTTDMTKFYENCNSWVSEYNALSDKSTMIALNDGGLCPIWDLLPSAYSDLKTMMKEVFNKRLSLVNEEFIKNEFNYDVDVTREFSGGSGTKEDPYLIENEQQIALIENYLTDGAYFKLLNDITITDNKWRPLGTNECKRNQVSDKLTDLLSAKAFNGHLDGNGKKISFDINIDLLFTKDDYDYGFGLFGLLNGATIVNLNVDGNLCCTETTKGSSNVAGLIAGWAIDSYFENCNTYGKVDQNHGGGANYGCVRSGGFVGIAKNCVFNKCTNYADVSAGAFYATAGGLVGGNASSNYVDCKNNGKVDSNHGKWIFGSDNHGDIYGKIW